MISPLIQPVISDTVSPMIPGALPPGLPGLPKSTLANVRLNLSTRYKSFTKEQLVTVDEDEKVEVFFGQDGTPSVFQDTDLDKPVYTENAINGHPALKGELTDTFLENTTPLNIAGDVTIFVVAQPITIGGFRRLISDAGGAGGGFTFQMNPVGQYGFTNLGVKDYAGAEISVWQVGVPQIAAVVFDSNFDVSFYKNGSFLEKITGTSAMLPTTGQLQIGALSEGFNFNGFIGQVVVYDKAFSVPEITEVAKVLEKTWDIPLV